jgi:hypothetical protein
MESLQKIQELNATEQRRKACERSPAGDLIIIEFKSRPDKHDPDLMICSGLCNARSPSRQQAPWGADPFRSWRDQ